MPALHELERLAYRAILRAEAQHLAPHIVDDDIPAAARIAVYQNNAREGFTKALAASYPVIHQLVGEPCFRSLARQYMLKHPSRSGDLQSFGVRFPSYLETCYANSVYDYLADVARLEWACEEVRIAPGAGCVGIGGLSRVPESRYAELRFWLHPAHRIVTSPYPVLTIWQGNQQGDPESVDLRMGAEHVLIVRQTHDLELHRWPAALARFTRALGDGVRIIDAYEIATDSDPAFDPADALVRLSALNLLSGFYFATSNSME